MTLIIGKGHRENSDLYNNNGKKDDDMMQPVNTNTNINSNNNPNNANTAVDIGNNKRYYNQL